MNRDDIIGKVLIVGLTRYDATGTATGQRQVHGEILRVSDDEGLIIEIPGGAEFRLPPELDALQMAPAGEFRAYSTGITVNDPDFIAMWELHEDESGVVVSWKQGAKIDFPSTEEE